MTWQGVPWAVGAWTGGAPEVPVEAARAVAYQALGGDEGPAAAGDCRVLPLAVPGAGVRIMPGTVGLLNRFPGGAGQAYLVRQPEEEEVAITPTGGGARNDLVCVVLTDPQYAGQVGPADAAHGPYVETVVYTGVGAATKLSQVDPDQTGYALARVELPAGTGTVTAAMIEDVRNLPNPKTKVVTKLLNLGAQADDLLNNGAYDTWPVDAHWSVTVPRWAVKAHLELYVSGVRIKNSADATGAWNGKARLKCGSIVTADSELNPPPPKAGKVDTFTYMAAGEVDVPASLRGDDVTLEAQAYRVNAAGSVTVYEGYGTTVVARVTFFEDVSTDAFVVD